MGCGASAHPDLKPLEDTTGKSQPENAQKSSASSPPLKASEETQNSGNPPAQGTESAADAALLAKADKIFGATDRNGDWALSQGELAEIIKGRRGVSDAEAVKTVLTSLDTNQNNTIEADEWHAHFKALLETCGPEPVEEVLLQYQNKLCTKKAESCFKRVDDDTGDLVTKAELLDLLNPTKLPGINMSSPLVKDAIQAMEKDRNGVLTIDEWRGCIDALKTSSGVECAFMMLEQYELTYILKISEKLHQDADLDGDKHLTKGELSNLLKRSMRASRVDVAQAMLSDLDADESGSLDVAEFRTWIKNVYETQGGNSTWKIMYDCRSRVDASKAGKTADVDIYRRPIVGANWKCNPAAKASLDELIKNINDCDTSRCDVYVCPSSLHVTSCNGKFTNGAKLTPQNCNFTGCGAYTGEIAIEQMKDIAIEDVLIGHSERRGAFELRPTDDNETLATKLKYVLDAGMTCCYCVGEPLQIREQGLDAVLQEIDTQLASIYSLLDPTRVVIAYEPVWAIGTGKSATAEEAQATHAGIRRLISEKASPEIAASIRIQYGGSSNANNAAELAQQPDIDGFLVGGASLKPEFKDMVNAMASAKQGDSRRPILGANWKCNPASSQSLDELIGYMNSCDTSGCDVFVCPSTLHIDYCCQLGKFTNGAKVTPQNCNFKGCGAFTGEMAVEQMKDLGITNVLIGHSERRGLFKLRPKDDNETLAVKLKYALEAGARCIYCIGEPLAIRENGLEAVLQELDVQLSQIYKMLDAAKVVIAYEPVWAIGTGKSATAEEAQATHAGIRKLIADKASPQVAARIRIQYGGSSNGKNAAELAQQPDIDGFLVGGASLKPEFKDMVAAMSAARVVPFNQTLA